MSFFKDFHNEIKLLVIVFMIAVVVSAGAIFILKSLPSLTQVQLESQQVSVEAEPTEEPTEIDTSVWQTYRNEEFGFEVKYPQRFKEIVKNSRGIGFSSRGVTLGIGVSLNQSFEQFIKEQEATKGAGEFYSEVKNRSSVIIDKVDAVELEYFLYGAHLFGFETHIPLAQGAIASISITTSPGSDAFKEEIRELHKQILSTFRFIEGDNAVPLSSLTVGTNRIGNIDVEMLDEFTLVREIGEAEKEIVLNEIDERLIVRQDESTLVHHLYFEDERVSGEYSLVGCEFDCLTNYPIKVASLEQNGVTYVGFSDVTYGVRPSNFTEHHALYRVSRSGLEHFADIGAQGGFTIYTAGDAFLIYTSSSYLSGDVSYTQHINSVRNAQIVDTLRTETCYVPLGDQSLKDDRLFECGYEPRLFLFDHEGQLHFKVRNVTRDGIEQNSYFQLSKEGEFLDVTSEF